ncbi:efflux transporter, RND family, MFP subunit [Desulfurispirillum indicum S5]|uniref:Efflux transporter, RND family, MFP subunit n=1 Tax=Desulfurispirillum indicum (strain ATCC BAA-1389 / DSM 22839 / S5) TaxID=653733 RepID=E6W1J2_DESIS|nr:efflux RND transporter periplasmic adaptor subunit [Desulfurispirillum indicum]ADU66541.1 efflux transporter, RND family, MFP subunit [Desulfurispirillum indicum S5]
MPSVRRKLAIFLPMASGILLVVILVASRSGPQHNAQGTEIPVVSTIQVKEVDFLPRVRATGTVTAGRSWRAVAEVGGRVELVTDLLQTGKAVEGNRLLLRIESTDYDNALADAHAVWLAAKAQVAELESRRESMKASLLLEARALELAERELTRQQGLAATGTISQTQLEREERSFLQQRQSVQQLRNTLNQLPHERERLLAQQESARARMERARRDVERTRVQSPYAVVIGPVHVNTGQVVSPGTLLFEAHDHQSMEVVAHLPLGRLASLTSSTPTESSLPPRQDFTNLGARLLLPGIPEPVSAEVLRFTDALDQHTRTLGVVLRINAWQWQQSFPARPFPLLPGMFVEVELTGVPRSAAILLPRSSVRQDSVVLVVDSEQRLERRQVSIGHRYGELVQVLDGVKPGETVVAGDLMPAIEGRTVEPRFSAASQQLIEGAGAP